MKLQLLHVPDCPNTSVLRDRLQRLLAGRGDIVVEEQVIRGTREAAARGMNGSPTLLVDGVDPFAASGLAPSMSCRLYIDEAGTVSGAPSLAQLRSVLTSGAI